MFKNFKITNKGLYWGLIITFGILYLCVGFVSTLHSITFFHLANSLGLAILLGITYEVGQASVLFGLLMTKNKDRFLPWALMFLLTALQVTANVYASFKFMVSGGSMDWQYWQKSILFGVQASSPEMYQVIISWISGALLPVVALGMTALVAENIKLMGEEKEEKKVTEPLPLPEIPVTDFSEPSYLDNDLFLNQEIENMTPKIDLDVQTKNVKPEVYQITIPEENMPIINSEPEIVIDPKIEDKIVATIIDESNKVKDLTEDSQKLQTQFEKELIIPKKRGRPPKKEDKEKVVGLKKEKESLPKRKAKAPKKRKRIVNPLKKKSPKLQVIKRIEQINSPSAGEELIHKLEHTPENVSNTIEEPFKELPKDEEILSKGSEVVDVQAIPVKKN